MHPGLSRLSERERDVLRLLARGYDAKAVADQLSLSPYAVNERLRQARRKLGVTSSREAARMLMSAEGGDDFHVDTQIGDADPLVRVSDDPSPVLAGTWAFRPLVLLVGAVLVILSTIAAVAFLASGSAAPRVVKTDPAQARTIRPGRFILSVTFDRPMRSGSYSFVRVSSETYPDCDARPRLSPDRRTFTLDCTARADRAYEIWFNRPPYKNFASADGVAATPYRLRFRTSGR